MIYFKSTAFLNIEIKERKTQTQSQYRAEISLGLVMNTLCNFVKAVVSSYCSHHILTSINALDSPSVFWFAIFLFFLQGKSLLPVRKSYFALSNFAVQTTVLCLNLSRLLCFLFLSSCRKISWLNLSLNNHIYIYQFQVVT